VAAATLAACTPKGVPKDASYEFDILEGSVWYWGDKLESGCTDFMALNDFVSVLLETDPECSSDTRGKVTDVTRVSYATFSDELQFQGYGPWSNDIRDDLAVFNDQGDFLGFKPCPHTLTPKDISDLTSLSAEAAKVATTDDERKIMERVKERLEVVDLSALSSEQFGCTDAPLRGVKNERYESLK